MSIIFFDFDGVITDSYNLAREVFQTYDPKLTDERFSSLFEHNLYESLQKEENAQLLKHRDDIVVSYRARVGELTLFPGIDIVINEISAHGMPMIVSSGSEKNIKDFLREHNLITPFAEVYGYEQGKSKVDKLRRLMNQYDADASSCVFVSDTSGDIEEGNTLSIPTIGVTWGFHNASMLESHNPNHIVHTPIDLLHTLEQMMEF